MSLPNIPNITPKIDLKRHDVVSLLLASIALEEIGLSHILNAEGEKIQAVLKHSPQLESLLLVNKSVERTMRDAIKTQMLLQFKLEDTLGLTCPPDCKEHDHHHHHHHHDHDHEEDHRHHQDDQE